MFKMYASTLFVHYASFKGRARRREFWIFFFINYIVYLVFGFVMNLVSSAVNTYLNIYVLVLLLPSIAVAVRRIHDVNKMGWYILIPFYNLYLFTCIGNEGVNQYGADPIDEFEYLKELGKDLN